MSSKMRISQADQGGWKRGSGETTANLASTAHYRRPPWSMLLDLDMKVQGCQKIT